MKTLKFIDKLAIILMLMLFSNCSSDCNDDGDNGLDFDVKIQLTSTNGENLFINPEFDFEKLNIRTLGEEDSSAFRFREVTINNIQLIEYYVGFDNEIEVLYNGEQKMVISLTNKEFDTIDCNLVARSFSASNSGELICNCEVNDIITIEFNL